MKEQCKDIRHIEETSDTDGVKSLQLTPKVWSPYREKADDAIKAISTGDNNRSWKYWNQLIHCKNVLNRIAWYKAWIQKILEIDKPDRVGSLNPELKEQLIKADLIRLLQMWETLKNEQKTWILDRYCKAEKKEINEIKIAIREVCGLIEQLSKRRTWHWCKIFAKE